MVPPWCGCRRRRPMLTLMESLADEAKRYFFAEGSGVAKSFLLQMTASSTALSRLLVLHSVRSPSTRLSSLRLNPGTGGRGGGR